MSTAGHEHTTRLPGETINFPFTPKVCVISRLGSGKSEKCVLISDTVSVGFRLLTDSLLSRMCTHGYLGHAMPHVRSVYSFRLREA